MCTSLAVAQEAPISQRGLRARQVVSYFSQSQRTSTALDVRPISQRKPARRASTAVAAPLAPLAIRKRPRGRPGKPLGPLLGGLPESWWLGPWYTSVRCIVRPPTARTTRRLLTVQQKMPIEIFNRIMAPMAEDADTEIKRGDDEQLLPTRETSATRWFEYLLTKPTRYDNMFALEKADKSKHPRSHGCAHINISAAAVKSGELARELSLPFGNVSIVCSEPKRKRAMPTVTLRMFAFTLKSNGHINWPFDTNPRTKAMMRNMAKLKLKAMLDSPREFPLDAGMRNALTSASDGTLALLPSLALPRAPAAKPRTAARFLLR